MDLGLLRLVIAMIDFTGESRHDYSIAASLGEKI